MVLEHLFPDSWIEKKFLPSMILGIVYSLIGIFIARLLFGANSGIVSVMFTSILLIPSLRKMFRKEEREEELEKKFSLIRLFKDNKNLIKTYLGIFIGVYISFYLVSFLSMSFGWNITKMFGEQLFLDPAIAGRATYDFATFWNILSNNWWVLLATFLLSLISGDGATFFIVWNASAWAVIFAVRSVAASFIMKTSALKIALLMQLMTLPHTLLEGGAYILAGIAGAMISYDATSRSKNLKKFLPLLFLLSASFVLINYLFSFISNNVVFLVILRIVSVLGLVYFLQLAFPDSKHQEVFRDNYWLFIGAIILFIIGALIETGVLSFASLLNNYYLASATFFS